nr:hypothetical protein [Micromonospora provocatoris]
MTVNSGLRSYPFEPFTGDLPAELLEMVVAEPVSRVRLPDGRAAWLVLSYEHCCTVLADPRFSRLPLGATTTPDGGGPRELNMDGPAHAAVRRVAGRAFTARRIETFRPRVQRLVDELVDAMLAGPRRPTWWPGWWRRCRCSWCATCSASRPPTGPGSTPGSRG